MTAALLPLFAELAGHGAAVVGGGGMAALRVRQAVADLGGSPATEA